MPPTMSPIYVFQALMPDGSVTSIQWTTLAASGEKLDASLLSDSYLDHVRRSTLGLIRPERKGTLLRFRILGTPLALLEFSVGDDQTPGEVRLPIVGGTLVQPDSGRSVLEFTVRASRRGTRAAVRLCDYLPALLGSPPAPLHRRLLYGWTQAWIHRIVTVSFLKKIRRRLEEKGNSPVITIRPRRGEPI